MFKLIISYTFLFLLYVFTILQITYSYLKNEPLGYQFLEFIINFGSSVKFIILVSFSIIISSIILYLTNLIIRNNKFLFYIIWLFIFMLISVLYVNNTYVNLYNGYVIYGKVHQNIKNDNIMELKENTSFVCNKYRFIAHAGGQINQHIYTDSLEALNLSYSKGLRYFELDILKTSDNIYIAAHDWESWKNMTSYEGSLPPTYSDFKKYKLYEQYTPLGIDDINKWFLIHNDAILVTDKVNSPVEFSKLFIDNSRLMMELFSMKAVFEGLKCNILAVMPTWGIIAQIQDKVKVLKQLGISYIVVDSDVLSRNGALFDSFSNNGIKVYVYGSYGVNIKSNNFYGRYIDKPDFIKKCKQFK